MPKVVLRAHQEDALMRMKNGCILNGDVGSGKSLTSIAYYYTENSGAITDEGLIDMEDPCDLYIITTAQKRDKGEWEAELIRFELSIDPSRNKYKNKIVVDSWNDIKKYKDVKNAFFIFDEQRVVGYGVWVKSFLEISKYNRWILLTATPGDKWLDYVPVFIANGFFRNKTDFIRKHVILSPYTMFPSVERYVNEARLVKYKSMILVEMEFERNTVQHHININCGYDESQYRYIKQQRWNVFKDQPIVNAGEYCYCLRRCVNSSFDRQINLIDILMEHPKVILFYSFDYELDIIKHILEDSHFTYAEWNGHKHEEIPGTDMWVYVVQYTAGCEGWNCISTDTIIFYSQNYSYKVMIQAAGRIDRLNTPFKDLYYYHLKSNSDIDRSIDKALRQKKKFNELKFAPSFADRTSTNTEVK